MAGSRLAAASRRKRHHPYLSILLTYWLSSTPVMAYDSVDMASLEMPRQSRPSAPHYSSRGVLLSENSRSGYLNDSPYLSRRMSDASGGGFAKSEPRRHPANLPPVPSFRRPTPSLFPIHGGNAPAQSVAPQTAQPVMPKAPAAVKEITPAPRIITGKASEADLAQIKATKEKQQAAETLAAELKSNAAANTAEAPASVNFAVTEAPAPKPVQAAEPAKPRLPMPAATTIESGLGLKEIARQPEVIPLPDVPLPPRESLEKIPSAEIPTAEAKAPFSPATGEKIIVSQEPKPLLETPTKQEVIKAQPVISKGDKLYSEKTPLKPQPKLMASQRPVAKEAAAPDAKGNFLKLPQQTAQSQAPDKKAPDKEETTGVAISKPTAPLVADTSAENEAKSILQMSEAPEHSAPLTESASTTPEGIRREVIMQKLPSGKTLSQSPQPKPAPALTTPKNTPQRMADKAAPPAQKAKNILIEQVPLQQKPVKATAGTLLPKPGSSAQQAGAKPQPMPIRTKKEVAGEIESKLKEALAARGKLAQEPQHYTSPTLGAKDLPSEMSNAQAPNPAALANKPVTPKAVAKIQAAIEALRKANAEHAAGIGKKHERELQAVEQEKDKALADKQRIAAEKTRAEAEAQKLKQQLRQKAAAEATAKAKPAPQANSQFLRLPDTAAPAPAPKIMKMPTVSEMKPVVEPSAAANTTTSAPISDGEMALLGAASTKEKASDAQPASAKESGNAANFSLIDELERTEPKAEKAEEILTPLPEPVPLKHIKPQSSMKKMGLPFNTSDEEEVARLATLEPAAGPLPQNSPLLLSKEAQQAEAKASMQQNIAAITPVYTSTPVITKRETAESVEAASIQPLAVPLDASGKAIKHSAAEEALLFHADDKEAQNTKAPEKKESPAEMEEKPIALKPDDALVQEAIPASPEGLLITIQPDQPLEKTETQVASLDPLASDAAIVPMQETKVKRLIGGGKPIAMLKPPAPLPETPAKDPIVPEGTKLVNAASTPVVSQKDSFSRVTTPPFVIKKVKIDATDGASASSSAPSPSLSPETRHVLAELPSGLGAPIPLPQPEKPVEMKNPDTLSTHEARGVSIEMRDPGVDIQKTMEDAYNALMKSDLNTAMDRYQMVLETQPYNTDAQFGLATIYHRTGELGMARALYSDVLKSEPQNLEALNNLLVLVGQESPQEALGELEQLEMRNPDFSPIPAQMASIHAKLGKFDHAIQAIERAIQLEPENLAYQYNLAVLLDKSGQRDEAVELYVALKRAYQRGEDIPADIHAIQERLTFLLSNRG